MREVCPETQEPKAKLGSQTLASVLDKRPKRLQARAKVMLREIMYAPDRDRALAGIAIVWEEYGVRYPTAVETLTNDEDDL